MNKKNLTINVFFTNYKILFFLKIIFYFLSFYQSRKIDQKV